MDNQVKGATLVLVAILFSSIAPVFSDPDGHGNISSTGSIAYPLRRNSSFKVGVNYMSYGNRGGESNDVLNSDFAYFRQHMLTYVDARIVWTAIEPIQGIYSEEVLSNYKRLLIAAENYGLKVGITFWTQPAYESRNFALPSWVPSWSSMYLNSSIRAAWLNMVDYVSGELASYSALAYWQTMNEPYCSSSYRAQLQSLIEDAADTIRTNSDKPISCRFIMGLNPYTGYFTDTILTKLDFISVTIYNSPLNDGYNLASRGTWQTLSDTFAGATADELPLWVIEFGNREEDETQRLHIEGCLKRFKEIGIEKALAWAWQSRSPMSEPYNLANGVASGRPGFFELERATT